MPEVPKKLVPVKKEPVPVTKKPEVLPEKGTYQKKSIHSFEYYLGILIILGEKILNMTLYKTTFHREKGDIEQREKK